MAVPAERIGRLPLPAAPWPFGARALVLLLFVAAGLWALAIVTAVQAVAAELRESGRSYHP